MRGRGGAGGPRKKQKKTNRSLGQRLTSCRYLSSFQFPIFTPDPKVRVLVLALDIWGRLLRCDWWQAFVGWAGRQWEERQNNSAPSVSHYLTQPYRAESGNDSHLEQS